MFLDTACAVPDCPKCNPRPAVTHQFAPNIQEQLGTDPVSRLAAAIEKLANALNREGTRD